MTPRQKLVAALDEFEAVQRDGAALLATTPAALLDQDLLAEWAAVTGRAAEVLGDLCTRRESD